MFLLCFFLCSEEPVTTVALVSTLTGAPSTSGSPANLSSKTSYVSMKEEGTGLYTITIQPTSHISKSLHVQNVSISSQTEMYPSLSTVEPDFYASTARISSVPVSSAQCSSVPVFTLQILPASQLREPETQGERREEETPGRRGPTRR